LAFCRVWLLPIKRHSRDEVLVPAANNFPSQIKAADLLTYRGCVVAYAGAYFLVSEGTNSIMQLEDRPNLHQFDGDRVELSATLQDNTGDFGFARDKLIPHSLSRNGRGSCRPAELMIKQADSAGAGAAAASSLIGCPVKSGANFLLTDETSNVTVQLRGGNVRAGRRVQITGTMVPNAAPPAGATQVINVTNVKDVGGDCKGAAAAGAGAAAGGGGIKRAIVVGAVVLAVVGICIGLVARH